MLVRPADQRPGRDPEQRAARLTDDERAQVGTLYKQAGKEAAMLLGLKIVGPKLERFVREAQKLAPRRQLAVHCWRGGQRSQSMAWLFRQAGFEVLTLPGKDGGAGVRVSRVQEDASPARRRSAITRMTTSSIAAIDARHCRS